MTTIKPIELKGKWVKGFALDLHTLESEYLGDNEFGRPTFKTKRTELGELVFRLKNRGDKSGLDDIIHTASDFLINQWKIAKILDYIIPAPPSNLGRSFQPVNEIAEGLCNTLNIPLCIDSLVKIKATPELKGIQVFEKRNEILKDAFNIKKEYIKGKNILLFDDLFRSGATLGVITEFLYNKGRVKSVYVLALTKTRSIR